uniref:Uncharacterized protein n=1 Tax=Rhizophora mucronata TaxID=61149 RepID=A0A2P2QTW1_RHIMU
MSSTSALEYNFPLSDICKPKNPICWTTLVIAESLLASIKSPKTADFKTKLATVFLTKWM